MGLDGLDRMLEEDILDYLQRARRSADGGESHRWITNVTSVHNIMEARAGRGTDLGAIAAWVQTMVADSPDAEVRASVDRWGRDEVLRVIGEDVVAEDAEDE